MLLRDATEPEYREALVVCQFRHSEGIDKSGLHA